MRNLLEKSVMQDDNTIIESVKLLISRLEHLSVDSRYAHRASGLRGSLWRCVEEVEARSHPSGNCSPSSPEKSQLHCDPPHLERLMAQGYEILEAAAREINAPEK
jgi:hypothetical protein